MGCLAVCAGLFSCADDGEGIGPSIEIYDDYDLSQGAASDAAKQRIKDYYNKYGSYVLYEFTNKDAFWVMTTGVANQRGEYFTTHGDPKNVEAMLDFIEEIWLDYFQDDFLKQGGMPYRVFLADSLYQQIDYGDGYAPKFTKNFMINGDGLVIAGMNTIPTMTDSQKSAIKMELFNGLWDYYRGKGLVDNPEEFYADTDYKTLPQMSYELGQYGYYEWIYTEADLAALRNRGFIPNYSAYGYSVYNEIYMKYSETSNTWENSYTTAETIKANDYKYYMAQIMQATDAEAAEFLKYPAVAKKWNFLIDHYKETVGIDLRSLSK